MSAPALTWFDVTSFAPELCKGVQIAPISQALILGTVNTIVSEGVWGDVTTQARVLYAAHMATLQKRRGQPGAASQRSMGGISEAFGVTGPLSASFLSLTSYGQSYLGLAKTRRFRAGFSTGRVDRGIGGFSG